MHGTGQEVDATSLLRIGELSRRVGVEPDRLRVWERRYGLLEPARTTGGFRLYSAGDERRIRRMLELLDEGLTAADAARAVLAGVPPVPVAPAELKEQLARAFARFDESDADRSLSASLSALGEDATLTEVIYPLLRELGDAWECGDMDIAQEHFASNVIQRRLTALLPADDRLENPAHALLACPPGEHHVLGLIGLGVGLRRRGWRVTYLGADTPVLTIARTARLVRPAAVLLAATLVHCLPQHTPQLRQLASDHLLLLAGAGAGAEVARQIGGRYIDADPVGAATLIADSGWSGP